MPQHTKVITVCAAGKTSRIAAAYLREQGIDAYSLDGGMKAWTTAWNVAEKKFVNFNVLQLRRNGKGCLSYIVSSKSEAIIIDASLPLEVYRKMIDQHHFSVKYVAETHLHADHRSRPKEIALYYNVPLLLPVRNKVHFSYTPLNDQSGLLIGDINIQMLSTPGHTMESISFYIDGTALFTGDTIFTNGIGRPDLKADKEESFLKTSLLYHSLQKITSLPGAVLLFPAHTNRPVNFDGKMIDATIDEAKNNITVLQHTEEIFTEILLKQLPPTPPNYLAIGEKNLHGDYSAINPIALEASANHCDIL